MESGGIHIVLKADQLGTFLGVPITNTMVMSWLVMALMILVGYLVGSRLKKIPGRVQTFFEAVFSFILDYMEEVLESRTLAYRFFPLIISLFLFILLGNWLELFPGLEAVGIKRIVEGKMELIPLLHPLTTDLNVTIALAIIAVLSIEVSGVVMLGFFKYAGKFFNFHSFLGFGVGLIEFLSELARLISFSFRLFGNMFAGQTLIIVAMFFLPYFLPIPLMLYEVFVGLIQASIFALLTLFFLKLAIAEPH